MSTTTTPMDPPAVPTLVNGVNVSQLQETVEAIERDPSLARFRFRAHHRWVDGTHAVSRVQDFYGVGQEDTSRSRPFELPHDEPPVILGQNRGVNPVEYLMSAVAGCVTTSFVVNAAARGIELQSVRVELDGDIDLRGLLHLDESVNPGYESIRMRFHVESDAPRQQIEELLHYAKGRSPVFDTITRPVPVQVEIAS